jgi:ubiquinone/menaquinone biosynthesis C-methylase UbiE
MARTSIYDSERLAAAYARSRPPVHQHIMASAKRRLEALGVRRARRALDVGCGAGLSTAALHVLADDLVGLEPVATMLRYHRDVAPGARFVVGRAERLPFAGRSFELLAAAGALNYADLDLVLPEVARVLTDRGLLLVYDFSGGRRLHDDPRLDAWFESFLRRYPYPPGYAMDVKTIDFGKAGLRLDAYEPLVVAVPMTGADYVAYAMSETNVELALSRGGSETEIREWCAGTLADIFAAGPRDVLFDAYLACIRPL